MAAQARGVMMGLDVGTRRIGVARSDELGLIASPETTVPVAEGADGVAAAVAAVAALARTWSAGRVVVGMPRNMRGETRRSSRVDKEMSRMHSAIALHARRHIPVSTYDERSDERGSRDEPTAPSVVHARRSGGPSQLGRTSLDARAAAIILQSYLDRDRERCRDSDTRP